MTRAEEYLAQDRWRPFEAMLDRVPCIRSDRVLDLGCGPGAVAARLSRRVATVVGVDGNEELLAAARTHCPETCTFEVADLRSLPRLGKHDGLWSSFTAAYFPQLDRVLPEWLAHVRPGGWVSFVEVDRMFAGHAPLDRNIRAILARFTNSARTAGLYDFDMGSKLAGFLRDAGVESIDVIEWRDPELAFDGPAEEPILSAWRQRFARLQAFAAHLGEDGFAPVADRFLRCIADSGHRSHASVVQVIGRMPNQAEPYRAAE